MELWGHLGARSSELSWKARKCPAQASACFERAYVASMLVWCTDFGLSKLALLLKLLFHVSEEHVIV